MMCSLIRIIFLWKFYSPDNYPKIPKVSPHAQTRLTLLPYSRSVIFEKDFIYLLERWGEEQRERI